MAHTFEISLTGVWQQVNTITDAFEIKYGGGQGVILYLFSDTEPLPVDKRGILLHEDGTIDSGIVTGLVWMKASGNITVFVTE